MYTLHVSIYLAIVKSTGSSYEWVLRFSINYYRKIEHFHGTNPPPPKKKKNQEQYQLPCVTQSIAQSSGPLPRHYTGGTIPIGSSVLGARCHNWKQLLLSISAFCDSKTL
jgi:hypothetical protein